MRFIPLLPAVLLSFSTAFGATQATAPAPAGDLREWCRSVTRAIPQINSKKCIAAGLTPVPVKSVNGRHIMLREFPALRQPSARVLVVGGIHGDELTAVSIVFRWLELLQQPTKGSEQYHWRVVPLLNPDGLLAKRPTRVNARGVDLNRNFPSTNWSAEAARYWAVSTRRDPRRYPGTAPASEPESKWLHDEIKRFKPDVVVSVHAPHGILDFDAPVTGIKPPSRFGRLHFKPLGVYPGSLGNFGAVNEGVPVVTLELPHALNMPTEEELAQIWRDMEDWLRANLVERKPGSTARSQWGSGPDTSTR